MFSSSKYSHLILRLGLAFVFFWFGIHKFFNPQYWLDAWVPASVVSVLKSVGLTGIQFVYLNGIFEVMVGLSLLTNLFTKLFTALAFLFLVTVMLFQVSFNEIMVRDVGLMGGLLSLFFWPQNRLR